MRQILEKKWEFGKDTCLAFINLDKAFDNINIQKIWKVLHKANASKGITERIKNIYKKC
jgi:hypothetical protein